MPSAGQSAVQHAFDVVTIVNIIALLLSPVLAVLITLWFQWWNSRSQAKTWVFHSLLGYRHAPLADEPLRALNSIDAIFYNSPNVRALWHEYLGMLNNQGLQNENGYRQRQVKNLEMLAAMAKDLGYGTKLTHLDIDRVYTPIGYENQRQRNEAVANEFLRVLRQVPNP